MHWAGVNRAGLDVLDGRHLWFEIGGGAGNDFLAAARGTEMVGFAGMFGLVGRSARIDCHAADGIVRGMIVGNGHVVAFLINTLDRYTPTGYSSTMQNETKKTVLSRLGRIEGQVRGLSKMIESDRYCIDVVNQVQAVIAALRKTESEILKDHISHCVEHAIKSGNKAAQREKVQELVDTLSRTR